MLFNSLAFLAFLPLCWILYWMIHIDYRKHWLLLASYFFYFWYNPWFGLLLPITTIIDFYAGKKIGESTNGNEKKFWLTISLACNLGVLLAFKYSIFFLNSILQITQGESFSPYAALIVPAGLSFYTFQSIGYVMDVYRDKVPAEKKLLNFALFVSFFPQLVAGPVERYGSLMPQLEKPRTFGELEWNKIGRLLIWGYFKKMVIADRLSLMIAPVYDTPENFSSMVLLSAGFLFAVQVYCDFSGYTDIATACAKMFGCDLAINWKQPLLSGSLTEFWKRNHISITSWFRDYLYISLGGNRVPILRWYLNLFLVFIISGLWHGANWTFLFWGLTHAIVFCIEQLIYRSGFKGIGSQFLGWIYFIAFHSITIIAFRAASMGHVYQFYEGIFTLRSPESFFSEWHGLVDYFPMAINFFLVFIFFLKELQEWKPFVREHTAAFIVIKPTFYMLALISIFVIGKFNAQTFVYFQF